MDGERRAVGEVEPGEQEEVVAGVQVGGRGGDRRVELDDDVGRSLVALPGGVGGSATGLRTQPIGRSSAALTG